LADVLRFELAKKLAESLTTIGHPRFEAAVVATAVDLVEWCKGAFIGGVVWSAEAQAEWLVREARQNWPQGWPERGGTPALHETFRQKFCPPKPPANGFVDYGELACICESGRKFKDCCRDKPVDDPVEKLRTHSETVARPRQKDLRKVQ